VSDARKNKGYPLKGGEIGIKSFFLTIAIDEQRKPLPITAIA